MCTRVILALPEQWTPKSTTKAFHSPFSDNDNGSKSRWPKRIEKNMIYGNMSSCVVFGYSIINFDMV